MAIIRVGRRYHFRAIHALPAFPEPWCHPHQHDYTVEIEAEGGTQTDALDDRWAQQSTGFEGSVHLLDSLFEPSTVENIAEGILGWFEDLNVVKVTVWEDQARYGTAARLGHLVSPALRAAEIQEAAGGQREATERARLEAEAPFIR